MKNKKGFTLIEILIASAFLAGLGLVVSQIIISGNKAVKTTEVKLDALDFEGVLEDLMRDRSACTRSFGKVTITPTSSVVLREGYAPGPGNLLSGSGIYNANNQILWQEDSIVIGDLRLKSVTIPATKSLKSISSTGSVSYTAVPNYTSLSAAQNRGYLEMQVLLEKTQGSKKTYSTRDILLKLYLTTQVYNDTGISGDPANDYRIDWCQLSGSKMIESGSCSAGHELVTGSPKSFCINPTFHMTNMTYYTPYENCAPDERPCSYDEVKKACDQGKITLAANQRLHQTGMGWLCTAIDSTCTINHIGCHLGDLTAVYCCQD